MYTISTLFVIVTSLKERPRQHSGDLKLVFPIAALLVVYLIILFHGKLQRSQQLKFTTGNERSNKWIPAYKGKYVEDPS